MAIEVKKQKNGKVTVKMLAGEYRLLQWVVQSMVTSGTTAEQRDKIAEHIAPGLVVI